MNGKHTPGPWYYDRATHTIRAKSQEAFVESRMMGDYMGCIVAGMDEATGGEIRANSIPECKEERDANGFILAAAPKLLEACQAFTASYEACGEVELAYHLARAAIRKATRE
jgi:hypothetical protein